MTKYLQQYRESGQLGMGLNKTSRGRVVPMGQLLALAGPEHRIETQSLGSCVGVTLYDPKAQVGGMLHSMFPIAAMNPACAVHQPAMYTDTGLVALLAEVLELGADKHRLVAKMAGAAQLLGDADSFRLGVRNAVVVREMLRRENIPLIAEDVGGTAARRMAIDLDTGETTVTAAMKTYILDEAFTKGLAS